MLRVDPVIHELLARKTLALCYLVLVMGKNVIHTASMQIIMLAQVLHRHSAALDMPTGKSTPPWAVPRHLPPWFSWFPQGKIFRVVLVRIHPFSNTGQHILKLITRKLPIVRKALDVIINITLDLVSYILCQQPLDNSNHLSNMLSSAWKDMCGQYIQFGFVSMECFSIILRDLQRCFPLFARLRHQLIIPAIQHLLPHMTDICNIFDVQNPQSPIFKGTAQPIGHSKRAQIANMNIAIDGGAAGVHLDPASFYRNNLFNPSSQGIIDIHSVPRDLSTRHPKVFPDDNSNQHPIAYRIKLLQYL